MGLESLERRHYRSTFDDGILDLGVGLMFVATGSIWIWAEEYAALAGIVFAAFVPPLMGIRAQITRSRGGYVRLSSNRRRGERAFLGRLLLLGVVALACALAGYAVLGTSAISERLVVALPALLLAIPLLLASAATLVRRFALYSSLLVAIGIVTVFAEGNPGWPQLAAGCVMATTGSALLARYIGNTPPLEDGDPS